ncbi:uncharacterized protein LOC100930614 [Anopheles sinensis]|uniref:Uncharacterized protein LOC100930614 n=1 Tax=Anopheles sinensis TaxID=74873 RepID=A0A084W8L7_ANOSI|nr:uncharacterized protein LOC100930614 [Anopheles sinensis]
MQKRKAAAEWTSRNRFQIKWEATMRQQVPGCGDAAVDALRGDACYCTVDKRDKAVDTR